jgi:NAD(P)H-dependent FMN reductase
MVQVSTIALFASSRRGGNTGQLMDRIAAELDIEVVDLAQKRMTAYDYEHRNRGDDFEPLMKHVLEFDQIIFATPVYWYSVAPPMKTFLDRISDFLDLPDLLDEGRRLRGKRAYVVCTSIYEQVTSSFINAFVDTFTTRWPSNSRVGSVMRAVSAASCPDHDQPVYLSYCRQVAGAVPGPDSAVLAQHAQRRESVDHARGDGSAIRTAPGELRYRRPEVAGIPLAEPLRQDSSAD